MASSNGNNPNFAYAKARRKEFEALKRTPEFKRWKQRQYKVQRGKCAWCIRRMPPTFQKVHTDHALALFQGGSNKYSNLVLSHAYCNMKKWIRIDGVPQWIVNAHAKADRREALGLMRDEQRRLAKELKQEAIAEELLWIV